MKLSFYNSLLLLERKKCIIIIGVNFFIREFYSGRMGEMVFYLLFNFNLKCLM